VSYYKNRLRARTENHLPTATDQSQAAETDINVIVRNFMKHGEAPGAAGEPLYGDFTELPNNLRDFIETARTLNENRNNLPQALRALPVEQLLSLPVEEMKKLIDPPKQEEPKA